MSKEKMFDFIAMAVIVVMIILVSGWQTFVPPIKWLMNIG